MLKVAAYFMLAISFLKFAMRLVIQRVTQASVTVGGKLVGRCGRGLCILVGITHRDTAADADWLAEKQPICAFLRMKTGR